MEAGDLLYLKDISLHLVFKIISVLLLHIKWVVSSSTLRARRFGNGMAWGTKWEGDHFLFLTLMYLIIALVSHIIYS